MSKRYLLILLVLMAAGCQKEPQEWNPIFEATNFNALKSEVDRSLTLMEAAYEEAAEKNEAGLQEKIDQARQGLLALKDYYLPLTTVRQNIYDAERHLKLNRPEKAQALLEEARSIVAPLGMATKNPVFDKIILELNAMLEEAEVSLKKASPPERYQKLKGLGEHVNLMLTKGELVLAGIEFEK